MLIQTLLQWEHVGFKGSIQQLLLLRNFWRDMNHQSQNKIEDIWDFYHGSRFLPISIFALIYCICFSVCFLSDSTWIHSDQFLLYPNNFISMHTASSTGKQTSRQADKQELSKITQTVFLLCNPKWNQCFLMLPSPISINELCFLGVCLWVFWVFFWMKLTFLFLLL